VLVFIGAKMLATMFHVHVDTPVSLLVVAAVLLASVALSLINPSPDTEPNPLEEHGPPVVPLEPSLPGGGSPEPDDAHLPGAAGVPPDELKRRVGG
jgi:hypothetical protein